MLCKAGAYVIKRAMPGAIVPESRQVTWSRFGGPVSAWREALQRAGIEAES